jgi:predicted transcriptional regulator
MPEVPGAEQYEQSGQNATARQRPAAVAIRFPDPIDTSGHTVVPNSVLDDDQLGPETRLIYIMLRRLATVRHARPIGQRELARHIGIPTHRISRHLTLLQRRGLIRIDGQPSTRTPLRYSLEQPVAHDDGLSTRSLVPRPQSRNPRAIASQGQLSLVDRLIIMGVDPHIAGQLVAKYPKERVAGALRAVHRRRPMPRDPAAWVVAAIRQGWVAPSAAVVAREWQAAQEKAIVAWERRADAALAGLPVQTQESLRRQATELIERRFDRRLAASKIGALLVTVEVRRLVAEQVGIPTPQVVAIADAQARSDPPAG